MRGRFVVAVVVGPLFGCPDSPSKHEAPAKTEPAAVRPGRPAIERARQGAQKANEAAVQRTDDAVDRAMKGETVERGVPEPR